ncbi:Mitochondrial glycoprotein [Arabidopsis thaliana x Arabidopsis arenosa]|uniref:Mitochondrial glycoprotein n=1 Tax=Arabidopsis thaliana x Arabidopsis arenosa TaxID=1240361 RepID=A0A8T2AAK8_9BRAS|nr:Mitochondrial glycoprotein [Arabidopsis thaliana x Arabidopsis arenosa]
MALAWCVVRRSASKFASVCGGQVRSISTVVNRPSLALLKPSPLRPFVSRGFHNSTVVDDHQLSSEQTLLCEIDSEIKSAFQVNDVDNDEDTTPESLPFRIDDDGGETVTLTRDYEGEHIKVVVGMPRTYTTGDPNHGDDHEELKIPLILNVTKKSGLSLEFRCAVSEDDIDIDGVFVNHSGDSSKDQLANEGSDFKNVNYDLEMAFYKYLDTRLEKSTLDFLYEYMTENRQYVLWLKDVEKFLEE